MSPKRNRALTVLMFAMLIVILLELFLLIKAEPTVINNYVQKKGDPGLSIVGPQGEAGDRGLTGLGAVGLSGKDGSTTIINTTTNVPVPGPQGDKGVAGDIGSPGRKQVIHVTLDCVLESQYEGDDLWQFMAQLPKPCKAE